MLAERQRLENRIISLQSQLKALPKGKLLCARNGKHFKWYHSDGHKHSYIPKKNQILAEKLAVKRYLSLLAEDCVHEKKAIDQYLKYHESSKNQAEKFLSESSEYQRLLAPYFKSFSQELLEWMNSPYDRNTKYPEQLTQKTLSGHIVRSKSEALIDMILYMNKIPFRYECSLELDGSVIYPDFTIRHPQTGELHYWEHFGMMDDPRYARSAFSRQQLYAMNGIIPSHQLITTYETKEHPLDVDVLQKIVDHYFL